MIPRVLHCPFHSPYVEKLSAPLCTVANRSPIPKHVDLRWLLGAPTLDGFDLVHVHFFEGTPIEDIKGALGRCQREHKAVVVTVHDLAPVFSDDGEAFRDKIRALCALAGDVVTLTAGAADELLRIAPAAGDKLTIIPHGYALPPDTARTIARSDTTDMVGFAMYGSLRRSRAIYCAVADWRLGLSGLRSRMNVLLRPMGPADPASERAEAEKVIQLAAHPSADLRITMKPYLGDAELGRFLAESNVLLMPYVHGTHSGQLELAFDLDLIPVITNVGFYADQWKQHARFLREPIWVDWSDGATHLYGGRLIEAMIAAHEHASARTSAPDRDAFLEHRRQEHTKIIEAHREVYTRALTAARAR